jgi:hypothetical protein
MHGSFRRSLILLVSTAVFSGAALVGAPQTSGFLAQYKGTPYQDSQYQGGAQKIPGRVLCAYYDLGGEGVAYHDTDAENHGSGELNKADGSYLNEFRKNEGVDTSYTKFGRTPPIDDSAFNKVEPPPNLLYVGWTEAGEWFNITVDVAKSGEYTGDLLYTSNRGGALLLDVNGEPATGPLKIISTFDDTDPLEWRQYHHWSVARNFVRLNLPKGKSVLAVHILAEGHMNLAMLDFRKAE